MNQDLVQATGLPVEGECDHPGTDIDAGDARIWAARIAERWRASVQAIIDVGRILIEAKERMPHGAFGRMCETELPFSARTAQRLMAIASDIRLSNPTIASYLPASWTTLSELTDLTDAEFSSAFQQKIIRPDMIRADVDQIRALTRSPSSDGGVEGHASKPAMHEPTGRGLYPRPEPSGQAGSAGVEPGPSETQMPSGGLAIAHNRIEAADSLDFFPTPPWATRALFEHVLTHLERRSHCKYQSVLEPACGEGHMAEVLKEYFPMVIATDVMDYGKGFGIADFLDDATFTNSDWIITNPPFGDKMDAFILKALDLAGTGVAMFVRLQCLETVGRYEKIFRDKPPTLISFFCERVPLHKGRWEPEGATFTAYIWLVWLKGAEPRAPFWIPPGCRVALSKPEDVKKFGKAIVEGEAA